MTTHHPRTSRTLLRAGTLACLLLVCGCAKNQSDHVAPEVAAETSDSAEGTESPAPTLIPDGQYADCFERTKHALRDLGFLIERVDAQSGVITTQPKGSGGLATPWDREQVGVDQELNDMFHRQTRVVRVEFSPADAQPGQIVDDLRAHPGPIALSVRVTLSRSYQPGRRINTNHIHSSTYTADPKLAEQGMSQYTVAYTQDHRLAQKIIGRVLD